MKNYAVTYHHHSITKWFFIITILFSLGGFSNYVSPEARQITSELIIQPKERSSTTVCYQKRQVLHIDCCFFHIKNNELTLLHTQRAKTKVNTSLFTVCFLDRLIFTISYPDEEGSFQVV
ncbi:hypothetical protein [Aquimarina sp. 2304DJ70-9]|uniref:hypothetical protein n=1 Tax=Aquimarina penaris TaxID=3231044 RepID=UPI003461962B